MKTTALLLTILTGFSFASISMIVSRMSRDRISFFRFYAVSNLLAAAAAWVLMPDWKLVSGAAWGPVLLLTGAVGFVNTASQAAFVCSLKWGHNGLSAAIRNAAAMISLFFGLLFLHEKISPTNFAGVVLVILSLAVIALFSRRDSISPDLKKWIPAVVGSLLLSGMYQILLTGTVLLPETTRRAGLVIPCMMGFCSVGNLIAAQIERKFRRDDRQWFRFEKKDRRMLFCWAAAALLQYYLLMNALSAMREAAMASLTWPMLIGVNVTVFSVFCRLKWKEKYPPATVLGMAGCVLGIILMIAGRK